MTRARLKPTTLPPQRDTAPSPQPDLTLAALAGEGWRQVRQTLTAIARIRDGDQAARKTEIRRRMRALARALRDEPDAG